MKKKNFITVLLLFTISFVYSQNEGINFSNINLEEALKKAESENKMIFIDAYASWCGPCKMMDKTIFKDIDVGDFYNENFINLKIDMEKGEGPKLKGKFGVTAYPTLLFVDYEGTIIKKAIGYHKKDSFIHLGNSVLKKH